MVISLLRNRHDRLGRSKRHAFLWSHNKSSFENLEYILEQSKVSVVLFCNIVIIIRDCERKNHADDCCQDMSSQTTLQFPVQKPQCGL